MRPVRYTYLLTIIFIATSATLKGQQQFFINTDTVEIGDVSVISRSVDGAKGYRVTTISKSLIKDFSGASLSDLLQQNSTLVIKNYGSGGLATSSFRGMGASHTRVFWAGIPVNPPTSGQVDFSLVPVTFTGTVKIYHGASPAGNGTGGPGGSISLNSVPDWKIGTDYFFRQRLGSFGYISDNLSIVTGGKSWQLFTNSYIRKAENDFTYLDNVTSSDNVTRTRNNSYYKMIGISQELFLKKGNSIISGRYWLNNSDRELPGPVIAADNEGENQEDKQVWLTAGIRNYSLPVVLEFRGAYLSDFLDYENNQAGIHSVTRSNTVYFFGSGKIGISERSYLDITLSDKYSVVNSVNHDGQNNLNVAVLRTEFSYTSEHRLGLIVLAELNYSDERIYSPMPSIGFDFRLSENRNTYLKGNLGASLTLPTLNDLYWKPGGNPLLENETGFNSELSIESRSRNESGVILAGEVTIFNSRLWNMIKWLPGEYGIWSPQNISEVNSLGAEADARFEIRGSQSDLAIGVKYSFNHVVNQAPVSANDATIGKQLPYVPLHKLNTDLKYIFRGFAVTWFAGYSSLRYTTADNSHYLPGYIVNDLTLSYFHKLPVFGIEAAVTVNNIFNTSYEQIAYYPMPGRNYMLSVDITFGNRKR